MLHVHQDEGAAVIYPHMTEITSAADSLETNFYLPLNVIKEHSFLLSFAALLPFKTLIPAGVPTEQKRSWLAVSGPGW